MFPSPFAAAVRAWCAHEGLKLFFVPASPAWLAICTLLVGAAAAQPSAETLALALLVRLADMVARMPVIWDSWYWCLQIDGGLLVLLLRYLIVGSGKSAKPEWWADAQKAARTDCESMASWWATTARLQLACFYLAAGFWKINTSFLDPRTSCAPIFTLTLLPAVGLAPPPSLAPLVARASPLMTIVGEMAIGVLLLLPSRTLVRAGTLLALVLHLGIALTPSPNNATPFSLACAVRLVITQSRGAALALDELATLQPSGLLTAAVTTSAAAASMALAYRSAEHHPPPGGAVYDWWIGFYVLFAGLGACALLLDRTPAAPPTPPPTPVARAALRPALVLLALVYALLPMLGWDLGSCNMCALRAPGGATA